MDATGAPLVASSKNVVRRPCLASRSSGLSVQKYSKNRSNEKYRDVRWTVSVPARFVSILVKGVNLSANLNDRLITHCAVTRKCLPFHSWRAKFWRARRQKHDRCVNERIIYDFLRKADCLPTQKAMSFPLWLSTSPDRHLFSYR